MNQLLFLLFGGVDNSPKYDLRKPQKVSFLDIIGEWTLNHAHIILPLAVIMLLLLIGCVIGVMVSSGNMTMTEANQYYYHLQGVI